jgi:molybdopterin synthase sulfur carrier subunit
MIEVLFFGQLTDITGISSLSLDSFSDTDSLLSHLQQRFPDLAKAKYMIAVENHVINSAISLKPGSSIAFMPPFSGG